KIARKIDRGSAPTRSGPSITWKSLRFFDLREVELDWRGAAEDADQHAELLLLGLHFFDDAREVGERTLDDANVLALVEADARLRLGRAVGHLRVDRGDVLLGNRRRVGPAEEAGDLGRVLDEVEGLLVELHLDEHVARIELAGRGAALPLDHLENRLGRDEDLPELGILAHLLDALLQRQASLVLVAGIRVHHVPLHRHRLAFRPCSNRIHYFTTRRSCAWPRPTQRRRSRAAATR